jgi:sirohydrochlorin cobaltochelatase
MKDTYSGILVIGHGTRDASGTKAYQEVFDAVRQMMPEMPVEGAFLEFAQPTIVEGIDRLIAQGATHIAAVPLFLSSAGHTATDLPQAIAQCVAKYPQVKISLIPHIGTHQRVVELSALRFKQALEGRRKIPSAETLLILTAHGSPEPEAIAELAEFAVRRQKLTPVGHVESCFAMLGNPQLADVLRDSMPSLYKRIVVQSHLLLQGRYHDMICREVETFRQEYPEIDWIVTEPLGPHRLLAQAVAEIVANEGGRRMKDEG